MSFLSRILGTFVPSSSPSPSIQRSAANDSVGGYYDVDVLGVAGGSTMKKSNTKTFHGVITSALWAIARTPALVKAIERVENSFGGEKQLSSVLEALRQPEVLTDTSLRRDAAENADAYLIASNLALYDSMEPMDAIRGIVGLCGDSDKVLKEAVETTYKTSRRCSAKNCKFWKDRGVELEEELKCIRRTAKQTVEARATSSVKRNDCPQCWGKTVSKISVMKVPPPCFVATWTAIDPAEPAQENLSVQTTFGVNVRFKLSVVIASHQNRTVCMFREGQNYYRVEGHDVKKVQANEWMKVRPRLALFTLQSPSDAGASGTTAPSAYNHSFGSRFEKKRRRGGDGHTWSTNRPRDASTAATATAKAEVIEVDSGEEDAPSPRSGGFGDHHSSSGGRSGGGDWDGPGRHLDTPTVLGRSEKRDPGVRAGGSIRIVSERQTDGLEVGGSKITVGANAALSERGSRRDPYAAAAGTGVAPRRGKATRTEIGASNSFLGDSAAVGLLQGSDAVSGKPDRKRSPGMAWPYTPPVEEWRQNWMQYGASSSSSSVAAGKSPTRGISSGNPDRASSDHEGVSSGVNVMQMEDDDDDEVQLVTSQTRRGDEGGVSPSPSRTTGVVVGDRRGGSDGAVDWKHGQKDTRSERKFCGASVTDAASACSPGALSENRSSNPPPLLDLENGGRGAVDVAIVAAAADSNTSPFAVSSDARSQRPADAPGTYAPPPPPPSSLRHSRDGRPQSSECEVHDVEGASSTLPPWAEGTRSGYNDVHLLPLDEHLRQVQVDSCTERELERHREASFRGHNAGSDGSGGRSGGGHGGSSALRRQKQTSLLWGNRSRARTLLAPADAYDSEERRKQRSGKESVAAAAVDGKRKAGGEGASLCSDRVESTLEDLTRAEGSPQDTTDGKGDGWEVSRQKDLGDGETLATIRGINLQQNHFYRIMDGDGWLTSQIIDIRVKQLQEKFPQNLYFDSSFFGFLCPANDKGGSFVVDYERVKGWTKSSRLPPGKSSLFDMRKLFIPINQANVHWVLVVVDMGGTGDAGGAGVDGGSKVVSFFDSLGRDGTSYVEAVQQYLVSELSSRDKTRQDLFTPESCPPGNAPLQHNNSDCGVLMLHVMEKLSTGSASELTRLSQEDMKSLRLKLFANIRE